MKIKNPYFTRPKVYNPFQIFVISQIIAYCGEAFSFIAITALVIKITGSGMMAGFRLLCVPITGLFLSAAAGTLGDRINEKFLLAFLLIIKSFLVLLFIANYNLFAIYILMFCMAALDIIISPPRLKMVPRLLPHEDIMVGNSLLTGAMGVSYILGPILSGLIIDWRGIDQVFKITGFFYLLAGILTLFIGNLGPLVTRSLPKKGPVKNFLSDIKKGLRYFLVGPQIRNITLVNMATNLLVASINVAFYAFAFDVLKISNSLWGIMMSLFYGANLASMSISLYFNHQIRRSGWLCVFAMFVVIAAIWASYNFLNSLFLIMPLQFLEGLLLAIVTIFINSQLQSVTKKEYLGRIIAINNILNNLGKLFSIIATFFFLRFYPVRNIFLVNCICLLLCTLLFVRRRWKNRRC